MNFIEAVREILNGNKCELPDIGCVCMIKDNKILASFEKLGLGFDRISFLSEKCLHSNCWEIVREEKTHASLESKPKPKPMTFVEACEAMRKGHKVRRPSWRGLCHCEMGGPNDFRSIILVRRFNNQDFHCFENDICATDWEIVE